MILTGTWYGFFDPPNPFGNNEAKWLDVTDDLKSQPQCSANAVFRKLAVRLYLAPQRFRGVARSHPSQKKPDAPSAHIIAGKTICRPFKVRP